MRADADFMVYVAARWPSLVKEAVLLGVPARGGGRRDHRRAVPVSPRLGPGEPRGGRRRAGPGGAAARRTTPAAHRRGRPGAAGPGAPGAGPADAGGARAPGERQQPRDPQARRPGRGPAAARRGRRRRLPGDDRRRPEAGRPDDGVLENAAISQEENPAPGVVWYADGQLHLDHTVLAVEGLKDMTRIGTGVVYGDDEGRVVYAADDGSREVLGHKDPEVPVAATDETGWAAWVETGGRPDEAGRQGGHHRQRGGVGGGGRRCAGGGGGRRHRLLRRRRGGARAAPGRRPRGPAGHPARPPRRPLPDPRLPARRGHDRGRPVLLRRRVRAPGQGAELSPDGNLVATRLPGTDRGRALRHPVRRRCSRTAYRRRPRGHVRAGLPAHRDLRRRARRPVPGRELELRTCELTTTAECAVVARIPDQGGTPVLAR